MAGNLEKSFWPPVWIQTPKMLKQVLKFDLQGLRWMIFLGRVFFPFKYHFETWIHVVGLFLVMFKRDINLANQLIINSTCATSSGHRKTCQFQLIWSLSCSQSKLVETMVVERILWGVAKTPAHSGYIIHSSLWREPIVKLHDFHWFSSV